MVKLCKVKLDISRLLKVAHIVSTVGYKLQFGKWENLEDGGLMLPAPVSLQQKENWVFITLTFTQVRSVGRHTSPSLQ